ncbi:MULTISPECIES: ABC transporter permease [unclassified Sporolactobacillus]|uniref:ABC transporter permease n=1 Tax=unclassified Sporolactobacillus TaxID=2628533 RepID=UPI0023682F65|nr:ABC transporter permease [Sporolactobacillus sp. CQH2019]MDD9150395.1 ABC transporter permease [Sporolactobacillus sp. CQH2019]
MLSYCIKRVLMLIPVLLGMTLIVFAIIHAIPGNPALTILGTKATPEAIHSLNRSLGLDQPWYIQYFTYLKNILSGNLGTSIQTNTPIASQIWPHLAATIELSFVAMIIAVLVGINAGIISAWKKNSVLDYTAMIVALVGVSMPIFWLGLLEQWAFSVKLNWLPSIGRVDIISNVQPITNLYLIDALLEGHADQLWMVIRHLILPSIALATIPTAIIARMTRSSMLEVLKSDYIRTAKAKGQRMFWIVYKYALKNAFIPILTVIGLQTGLLLGGAILTETIFGWPGIGLYIYNAIQYRDYPVIQSGILVIAFIFVMVNFIVDLLYALIDPRIKYR